MDGHSATGYDTTNVLKAVFGYEEEQMPLYYGSILQFDWVEINAATAAESKAAWALLDKVIDSFARGERVSMVLLQASPFEREGKDELDDDVFKRKQRALMRYFTNRLRAQTLPGWPGEKGWQWVDLCGCLTPRQTPDEGGIKALAPQELQGV